MTVFPAVIFTEAWLRSLTEAISFVGAAIIVFNLKPKKRIIFKLVEFRHLKAIKKDRLITIIREEILWNNDLDHVSGSISKLLFLKT